MRLVDRISLILLAAAMISVGVLHFVEPEPFTRIVPPWLPAPRALVYVSGFFEIAGGVGVLVPATRKVAAWGLVALFIAVFPANLHMAVHDIQPVPGTHVPAWASWARLPFQLVLVAWALRYTRRRGATGAAPEVA